MKKLVLLGVITIFLITLLGTGTAMAIGPYKAIGKNPNIIPFPELSLKTNPDGDFVEWFHNKHYICQCTKDMNPDAIVSKLSEGWIIWQPAEDDPRYEWCKEYIYKIAP